MRISKKIDIRSYIQRSQPASLRLVDNEQFIMGQAMKLQSDSVWHDAISKIGKIYITKWKGFDVFPFIHTVKIKRCII
jgi:hypothetical protein